MKELEVQKIFLLHLDKEASACNPKSKACTSYANIATCVYPDTVTTTITVFALADTINIIAYCGFMIK